MKYCPHCGCHYREEVNLCADCQVPLTRNPPPALEDDAVNRNASNLVTICKFDLAFDAERAKAFLEAEGISAFVMDAATISLNQTLTWAAGGVRLQVLETYASKAIAVLNDNGFTGLTEPRHFHHCPDCHSTNIQRNGLNRLELALAVILLGGLLLFLKRDHKCQDCLHMWRA